MSGPSGGILLDASNITESDRERFWSKVIQRRTIDCWEWVAYRTKQGYGKISIGQGKEKKNRFAHRVCYAITRGQVPNGLTIDHICFNKSCVNPAHLECVTTGENSRRYTARITHCPKGHEYTAENTYLNNGKRACRLCGKLWARRKMSADQPKDARLKSASLLEESLREQLHDEGDK